VHRIASLDKTYDYIANVGKVLSSPGWASVTTDKLSLDDGENRFYVLIDEQGRVYIAITSKAYPSRYIYSSTDGATRGVLGGELTRPDTRGVGDATTGFCKREPERGSERSATPATTAGSFACFVPAMLSRLAGAAHSRGTPFR
jgi:hypothetical protein